MKKNVFNVGDKAWNARCGTTQVKKPCPVCFGKLEVVLILGNSDTVTMPCNYCASGYDPPKGYVREYEYRAEPEEVMITEVEILQTSTGEKRKYRSGIYGFDELFETREEALEKCKEVKAKLEKDQTTKAENIKKSETASYSWNAGYHMKEAKKHEKDAEYHRKMAILCKERAKKN